MTQQQIALVTGGSRGLGRNMVESLAQRGVDSIFTYRAHEDEARAVVAALEARGRRGVALPLDVGDAGTFAAFTDTVRRELARRWQRERFDFLVNNAGHGVAAPFLETTAEQLRDVLRVHLEGPFLLTQALAPLLEDGGRVLNVSSGLTRFTHPGRAAYASAKGGLEVLTRYLAKELAPRRITVNTIAPGAIETDFGGGHVRDDRALNQQLASITALGRVGRPDDIGRAVAVLLSPETAWITGQRIEISGGMFL